MIRYFLKNEEDNIYVKKYGMFEISTEKTVTSIVFPKRDKSTNDLVF